MRRLSMSAFAAIFALVPVGAASAEGAQTVRIEPRPYYGAVVTVEQGVRVWRPLPPTRHMIINPTNAPVSVNITDIRERVEYSGPSATAHASASAGSTAGAPRIFYGRPLRKPVRPGHRLPRH
jgi:hypothetical protein